MKVMPTPALLVMHPDLENQLLDPVARKRLGCVVDLVSDTAVGDLAGLVELD
jgi:hypothetical protein